MDKGIKRDIKIFLLNFSRSINLFIWVLLITIMPPVFLTEKSEKERTQKLSIKEGSATSVMFGFGSEYITPFALALKSNNFQIGVLNSLSGLFSPLFQIYGSKLMEKYSRKKIIVMFVALQALIWLPMAALSLLFWKNIFLIYLPWFLVFFYALYSILGSLAGPAWFSLMGDIVPEKIRGRYFGKRNKICGIAVISSTLIASFFLDLFKTHGMVLLGFSILFSLAFIFRLISANYFTKHYDPKFKLKKDNSITLLNFIKKSPKNNFGKFTILIALFQMAVNVGSIFFSVYMLKSLNFSYLTFILVTISVSVFSLLFMPMWGKFSDKYGNKEIIKIGSILLGIMPILWIFSSNPVYLILVPQLISGIGSAAFDLGTNNFIYDSVSRQNRPWYNSYYSILVGFGIFIGSNIGGLLAQYLSFEFLNIFLFLFVLSGIMRLIISGIIIMKVKEVRIIKNRFLRIN